MYHKSKFLLRQELEKIKKKWGYSPKLSPHQPPKLIKAVTSRQSPVTSYGQFTVTLDHSKVSNVCETARGVNERTTLVTGDWSLVTEDVMGSVTAQRGISDGCDGCDDFLETAVKNQS